MSPTSKKVAADAAAASKHFQPVTATQVERMIAARPSRSTTASVHGGGLAAIGTAITVGITDESSAVRIVALLVAGAVAIAHTWLSVKLHRRA